MACNEYTAAKLLQIHAFICRHGASLEGGTVKWGKCGLAIFLLEYARQGKGENEGQLAYELLQMGLADIDTLEADPGAESLADLGRLLQFFASQDVLPFDAEELLLDLDHYLKVQLLRLIQSRNFDLVTGALNPAAYLLDRHISRGGKSDLLLALIQALADSAVYPTPEQVCWPSTLFKDARVYLGLAHGSAGILLFISRCQQAGLESAVGRRLLDQGTRFLQAQYLAGHPIAFPVVAGHLPAKVQLGWCYGDLGVAYGLLVAGKALMATDISALAEHISLLLGQQLDHPDAWPDAGLAYGISGTTAIYQAFYRETGNPAFAVIANQALTRLASFEQAISTSCGFQAHYRVNVPGADWGLITGLAGIGLALLADQQQDFRLLHKILIL